MRRLSLKVKVGVYAALLTMAALFAGVVVMMVTLYFYQISAIDEDLKGDAEELVWDIKNFRDAPKDPRAPLRRKIHPGGHAGQLSDHRGAGRTGCLPIGQSQGRGIGGRKSGRPGR